MVQIGCNYFNWNIWITVCDDSSPVQCSVKSLFALLFVIDTDVWYLERLAVNTQTEHLPPILPPPTLHPDHHHHHQLDNVQLLHQIYSPFMTLWHIYTLTIWDYKCGHDAKTQQGPKEHCSLFRTIHKITNQKYENTVDCVEMRMMMRSRGKQNKESSSEQYCHYPLQ